MDWVKLMTAHGSPLYFYSMPHSEVFVHGLVVKAGTRDEIWPREAGLAHFIEHTVFDGTELFPRNFDLASEIETIGGRMNAWTYDEMTFYYNEVRMEYFRTSMLILSQQILRPLLRNSDIAVEKSVILEELKGAVDDPSDVAWTNYQSALYGSHPLAQICLGIERSIRAFKRRSLLKFMTRYYRPSRFAHVVVGDIEAERVLDLVNKYFPLERDLSDSHPRIPKTISRNRKEVIEEKDIGKTYLALGASIGAYNDRSSICLALFCDMIGGGESFPLFQKLRQKRGLCYAVGAGIDRLSDVGNFFVSIETTQPKRVIPVVHEVIQNSKSDRNLLERAKSKRIGSIYLDRQEALNIINGAVREIAYGITPKTREEEIAEINSVTIEEIEDAVNKYLNPDRFTISKVGPSKQIR